MRLPTSRCGTPLLQGRVLRSGDPAGLEQEMWALLALYQALRTAVTDAIQTMPGADPDWASYQIAAGTARTLVTALSQYRDEKRTRRRRSLTPAPGP